MTGQRRAKIKAERATVTVDEAGKILGVGRHAAYEGVRTGRIPAIRVSARKIVIPREALEKMLATPPAFAGEPVK